ncbi:P-loop containing nucleoside triphosphate hydrolase protein, partial [Piptocephalis cylindrospora]
PLMSPPRAPPGLERPFTSLLELLELPLRHAHLFAHLSLECPKGVLLYGPPGVGKTLVVKKVAEVCQAHLLSIHGPSLYGPYAGETEERLRDVFKKASDLARDKNRPCLLFIDELDALTPDRQGASRYESRVVTQLLTLLDGMVPRSRVVVVAATNRPNAIDPALRRPGRLDREIHMDTPNAQAREGMLHGMAEKLDLSDDVHLYDLAERTNGYVGADLSSLCQEAWLYTPFRNPVITQKDFDMAMQRVGPSMQRQVATKVDQTHWGEIGGLTEVKEQLQRMVEWPTLHRDTFRRLGLSPPRGLLLYGPPGCSKTSLVKAIASTSGASFFSLTGASTYSVYVGEAERTVRDLFQRARAGAPSVIFLDEVDALVGKRTMEHGAAGNGGDSVQERILSTLLNEMDGVEKSTSVLVIGATNRPDMLDAALMRPGRFDRLVYIPPPDEASRREILDVCLSTIPTQLTVPLDHYAFRTTGYTGADLKSVCREAAMHALRRSIQDAFIVGNWSESAKPSLLIPPCLIQRHTL